MDFEIGSAAILVTGAASGIGKAIAKALSEAGQPKLLLVDLDKDGLARVAGDLSGACEVATHVADLADPGSTGHIMNHMTGAFGRVDAVVNAAGLTTRSSMTDGTIATWDRLFAVNARAPYFLMQAAIRDMLDRGDGGSIVNILSMNAHCGAPDLAIYAATKGALQTLTKNAAHAHLCDGIRVNGINLGWAVTEAEDRLQREIHPDGSKWAARVGASMPLGRLLEPADAARLAVFLLSTASSPLSGACIDLDQQPLGAP